MNNLSGIYMLAEYDATDLFQDNSDGTPSADWKWCLDHAQFQHQEACEFMIYVGGETEDFLYSLKEMSEQGLSQKFISHLKHARDVGAKWAMFYA